MFIAGIDGGGTSAKLELRDLNGKQLCRKQFGPLSLTAGSREAYAERLREIFRFCGDMSECASLCIGGAGVTQQETGKVVREELQAAGFHGSLKLCGDHEIALRGAVSGTGCILIAGTGSIAYGINEKGEKVRVGGYGHLIDDCGSGYAIGRDALSLTVKTLDGRVPQNMLAQTVLKTIGADNNSGVINYVYNGESSKARIAALTPAVIAAAETNEPYSLDILTRNADDLFLMVKTMIRKLDMFQGKLALTGGLLDSDNLYFRMVSERVSAITEVIKPQHDALFGAAELAEEALKFLSPDQSIFTDHFYGSI